MTSFNRASGPQIFWSSLTQTHDSVRSKSQVSDTQDNNYFQWPEMQNILQPFGIKLNQNSDYCLMPHLAGKKRSVTCKWGGRKMQGILQSPLLCALLLQFDLHVWLFFSRVLVGSTQQQNLVDLRFILRSVSSDNYRLHQGLMDLTLNPWAPKINITHSTQDFNHILHIFLVGVGLFTPLREHYLLPTTTLSKNEA